MTHTAKKKANRRILGKNRKDLERDQENLQKRVNQALRVWNKFFNPEQSGS